MGALKDDLEQTHRDLTEKLQAGQASLRKELQEELRAELRELWSSEEERRREPRSVQMEACPELVPYSGLLCMMFVVGRIHHTV